MKERLIDCTTSISGPIKKNKLALFSNQHSQRKNLQSEVSVLKNNVKHFSQLFIATQNRKGDLGEFFQHENQMIPPSLSKDGVIRQSDKAVFIQSFEKIVPPKSDIPTVDDVMADGSMLVNPAKPLKKDQTFLEYGLQVFLPKISKLSANAQRIDIVWDIYFEESLKASTRSSRGKGTGRKMEANTRTPGKWESFLRNAENKTELFTFLTK